MESTGNALDLFIATSWKKYIGGVGKSAVRMLMKSYFVTFSSSA